VIVATLQRVTFYCPLELLEAVEAEMERSGRSKSGVIVDALRAHLARP
jgi:Ribbon-helix-helix protein, copG family